MPDDWGKLAPKPFHGNDGLGVEFLDDMDFKRPPQKGHQLQRSMPLPKLPKK